VNGHSIGMKGIAVARPQIHLGTPSGRYLAFEAVLLAGSVTVAALGSSVEQWSPTLPLVALLGLVLIADVLRMKTRTARVSSALTVLVVIMALFGPAPAVLGGCFSTFVGSVRLGTPSRWVFSNVTTYAVLGVVGGLWFTVLDDWVSPEGSPLAFATVAGATLLPLVALNFALVVVPLRQSSGANVRLAFVASFLPFAPWQLTSALIAGGAVFAYEQVGLVAVAVLAVVLAVTAPLLRSVVVALQRADSMSELRAVSDQRAAEVERLASDRARLLAEVLEVADHERRRLAETLHDGPLQRLLAVRQDLAERGEPAAADLDVALHETRAVMAAFHPLTSTELGVEATVRAAAEPFLHGRVALEVDVESGQSADPLLCSVARELVINAVKHARPSLVRVVVGEGEEGLSLEVTDNGRGIDSSQAAAAVQAGHVGLAVARRRVEDAGGTLEIATVPTGGTFVRATLPR
jgi:signal transduction histidine kinase